jgi:hypothetical protein
MALSAVVTLPYSSLPVGAPEIQALITISSSNATETIITQVVPLAWSTPEVEPQSSFRQNVGQCYIPPFSPVQPGGTLSLTFPVVFNSTSGLGTISVGALIYGNDGELIAATPATITIVGINQEA